MMTAAPPAIPTWDRSPGVADVAMGDWDLILIVNLGFVG